MIALVSAAEMRALDAAAIALGLPAFTLMELAGRGVVEHLLREVPSLLERSAADAAEANRAAEADRAAGRAGQGGPRVAVVCGGGGNGGDGFVAARLLADRGVAVTVYLAVAPPPGSAAAEHRVLHERCGGAVVEILEPIQLAYARPEIASAHLVLDALLGVGLSRPVTGHLAQVIEAINAAPRRWSIDLPSGLDGDRGVVLGAAVRAEATVSLGLHKLGAVTSPGFAHAGTLHLVDLGLPRAVTGAPGELVDSGRAVGWLEEADVRALAPASDPLDHKSRRGHVLVVGGAEGTRGAAELAATAAMRVGAGLCTWAAPGNAPISREPSLMTRGLFSLDEEEDKQEGDDSPGDDEDDDVFAVSHRETLDELSALAKGKAALCLGPGMSRIAAAAVLARMIVPPGSSAGAALFSALQPIVLDADALFALADYTVALPGPSVITPHPKEAALLLDLSTEQVEADRLGAARALTARFGCVVVLKGARTLICDGARAWLCSTGTAALATAGSGDVLAGAIAGLCAQGLSPRHAALLGVWLHGAAGRHLGERLGLRGVISSDLPAQLGLELAQLS